MQVKVREMKAEIARLNEQADAGERERSAKKHYEKRVRELAQELTGKLIFGPMMAKDLENWPGQMFRKL